MSQTALRILLILHKLTLPRPLNSLLKNEKKKVIAYAVTVVVVL
jgi:hypothetical protein